MFVGTSWKMTKTLAQSRAYAQSLAEWQGGEAVQAFILPPVTALSVVADALRGRDDIWVGAQNAHWARSGAFTGEVSMAQVKDAGAVLVEIGHSERRAVGETDSSVMLKVASAIETGLRPLVCVGESAAIREAGGAVGFVMAQAEAAVASLRPNEQGRVLLAYEPEWAIGEAGRQADPSEVSDVIGALAERLPRIGGILYGGSVDEARLADYLRIDGCDGAFIGRAAWTFEGFRRLLEIAEATAALR